LDPPDDSAEFIKLLTAAQPRLFRYIVTLLADVHNANNVLQETNVTLWTKAREFKPGSNFLAWAREVAYFKALSFVRDASREQLIVDHALVEHIFARVDERDEDERRIALRHCLSELDERQRQLLRYRYADGATIEQLARQQQRTAGAVKMALKRVRVSLLECIRRRIAAVS
jgi:RNA polymerase sigma-70 factor (ECF subfamily)